jgi:hypothetical protein
MLVPDRPQVVRLALATDLSWVTEIIEEVGAVSR